MVKNLPGRRIGQFWCQNGQKCLNKERASLWGLASLTIAGGLCITRRNRTEVCNWSLTAWTCDSDTTIIVLTVTPEKGMVNIINNDELTKAIIKNFFISIVALINVDGWAWAAIIVFSWRFWLFYFQIIELVIFPLFFKDLYQFNGTFIVNYIIMR